MVDLKYTVFIMRKKDFSKIDKIQDATVELILKEGAAAVSTIRIAKKVGISQSNVYLYFKNKDELIDSVFAREMGKVKFEQQEMNDKTLRFEQRFEAYIRSLYDFALTDPDSLVLIREIKFLKGQQQEINPTEMGNSNVVEELLQTGITEKIIKPLPIALIMGFVFNTIQAHSMNILKGVYTEADCDYSEISQLIWSALVVSD
ncbi:TetR/AcrR family transcriptional regulator [Listeria sp. FSL L7-1582]|uniref:TetR/AcrR family transcriptional regulator n=1 Tax=Listeria portnoyi TaxID=2713504 RepID=UPI00164E187C|nr:TetR/AcrR family transcriptional regulator [Listeria portnoyi]MBC6310416.1 TetR/AcrR family transcriptional regulator [Listeria portnoyi]